MSTWNDFLASEPTFATRVQSLFEAHRHHTLATLRRDGSPRITGSEVNFRDGELWLGAMWQSRKALDLQRDPRFALHSAACDPPEWSGDARITGRVEEITDPARVWEVNHSDLESPPEPSHLFRLEVTEVVFTRLGNPPDHLVIEFWREGEGMRRFERT